MKKLTKLKTTSSSNGASWANLKKKISESPAVTTPSVERNDNATSSGPSTEPNGNSTVETGTNFAIGDINFDAPATPELRTLVNQEDAAPEPASAEAPSTPEPVETAQAAWSPDTTESPGTEDSSEATVVSESADADESGDVAETSETGETEEATEEEEFVLAADDTDNPYDDHNATAVEVTPWDGTDGSPNDHIEGILRNQGYTVEEIYAPNENGQTLVDQVAQANELDDPNVIEAGQNLVVPTTAEATPPLEDVIVNEADPFANGDDLVTEGSDEGETIRTTGTDGDDEISVNARGGDDTVEVTAGQGDDNISVAAGDGTDTVTIDAGEGDDNIEVDVNFEESTVYDTSQSRPVRTTDSITVDGGEGDDTAVINADGNISTRFDEETGQTRFYTGSGTQVDFNDVEEVQVVDSEGEITQFIVDESGELVELRADLEVEPEAEVEVETEIEEASELSDQEALGVLDQNWQWVADSEAGDANDDSTARVDEGLADLASDDWSGRDNFVGNLTQTINPNAEVEGSFYTQEEADAAADELQKAASVVSENGTLVNIIDGGDDNDSDARDQKFDREDLRNGIQALSGETQGHIDTVSNQAGALQSLQDEMYNASPEGELRKELFNEIADLQGNEDYAAWTAGEIDFDEFLDRNEDGAEIVDILLDNLDVPEGMTEVAALNELIGASVFLADDNNFQEISAADGTHALQINPNLDIDLSLNIEGDIDATADLVA